MLIAIKPEPNTPFDRRQEEYWEEHTNVRRYDHPVVRVFAKQRVEFIAEVISPWRPSTALEVGCGDGFGMQYMVEVADSVYGCDKSRKMLDSNPADSAYLKKCDAYALPYKDSEFELVYCWELLHHLADPQRAVAEMARVASKAVLLCEPNCLNPAMALFGLIRKEERGLLRFTPSYPQKLLESLKLERVRGATVGCITPNRTPAWLAKQLVKLPYHIPLIGLYSIALGYKSNSAKVSSS